MPTRTFTISSLIPLLLTATTFAQFSLTDQSTAPHPTPHPSPATTAAIHFRRLSIHDPGINNIEAISFLIPANWRADGGIKWFPNYSILANLLMKISDPQTGATIEFLPIQNFTYLTHPVFPMTQGTNYMGNIVWRPTDNIPELVQTFYVKQITPQLDGLQPVAQEDLPNIAAQVSQMYGGQSRVKVGRVRYVYDVQGRPWEEDVYMTIVLTPTQLGAFWSVTSSYALRAPKGQLDALTPTMMATVNSAHLTQDWYSGYMYVQKLFSDRMMQGIRDAAALSATITQNSEEIRQMFADSYRQRSESLDHISRGYSEYIRGVSTYDDPYAGHAVQLPNAYNYAWVSQSGEYVLSNDASYNPNVGSTTTWQQMRVTPNP